jgi:hypothetical protein
LAEIYDENVKQWSCLEDCRAQFHLIRLALSDYFNGRGGPVWGQDLTGAWRQLRAVYLEKRSVPRGFSVDDKDFVLRAVEVRPK